MRTNVLTWTCYFASSNIYVHQANELLKFSPLQFVHGQELNISHLRIFLCELYVLHCPADNVR